MRKNILTGVTYLILGAIIISYGFSLMNILYTSSVVVIVLGFVIVGFGIYYMKGLLINR